MYVRFKKNPYKFKATHYTCSLQLKHIVISYLDNAFQLRSVSYTTMCLSFHIICYLLRRSSLSNWINILEVQRMLEIGIKIQISFNFKPFFNFSNLVGTSKNSFTNWINFGKNAAWFLLCICLIKDTTLHSVIFYCEITFAVRKFLSLNNRFKLK